MAEHRRETPSAAATRVVTVRREAAGFRVGEHRLDGDLWLPEGEGPFPGLVACSGYQGQKVIHPERFARALAPRGYAVLAFDYRGFGKSEGPRDRLVPQEQVVDVLAALSVLESAAAVDAGRVGLLGWGLGGGVAITAAANDERVKAVACLNGIGNGYRSTHAMHDTASWAALLGAIAEDRRVRAATGVSRAVPPFDIVRLRGSTASYVDAELYPVQGFGSAVTLESAEHLLRFHPERHVAAIAPRPLLIVHGELNDLHPVGEAYELYDRAAEPKRIEILPGKGHTEWMRDDDPTFVAVMDTVDDFFRGPLGPG